MTMVELPLFDKEGRRAGTVAVDEKLFGERIRRRLLHQVVIHHEANQREGNAHTKTRGEVEGSTRKPWPQKHTGMARAGTIRSPLWRHGGVVFGPRKREYRLRITDSMRRAALDSALLGKLRDGEVSVLEQLDTEPPKTRRLAALMKAIGFRRTVLLAIRAYDEKAWRMARNLPDLSLRPVRELNAYEVLRHKDLLLTREALEVLLAERSGGGRPS